MFKANVLAGNCGNYQSTFNYTYNVPNALVSYPVAATPNNLSTFSFSLPATKVTSIYPTETCNIQYTQTTTAHNYSLQYQLTRTSFTVSYTPCSLYDGICNPNQSATQQTVVIAGTPLTGSNGCPANISSYLSSQADNSKPISCTSAMSSSLVSQTGLDPNCSQSVLNIVPSDGSASSVVCSVSSSTTDSTLSLALIDKLPGTCSSYCSKLPCHRCDKGWFFEIGFRHGLLRYPHVNQPHHFRLGERTCGALLRDRQ